MKIKTDKILLLIMWFMAATLAIMFWFGTRYGFNLFSGAHWRHLALLQATRTPVKTGFYISLIVGVVVLLGGAYMLMRPWGAHRRLAAVRAAKSPAPAQTPAATDAATPAASAPRGASFSARPAPPPRSISNSVSTAPHTAPAPQPAQKSSSITIYDGRLRDIFTSAGYTVKQNITIGALKTNLWAIGPNEVLWLGGVGVSTEVMRDAVTRLNRIFKTTFGDDIIINVHPFILMPTDGGNDDIPAFADISDVEQYVAANPAAPLTDETRENFDAYSVYIDTLSKHIGIYGG